MFVFWAVFRMFDDIDVSDFQFSKYRDLIYNESGISFYENNKVILESRIKSFVKKRDTTVDDLFIDLKNDRDLFVSFLDSATTNLTRFFRNEGHFKSLRHEVIPDLIASRQNKLDKVIRIWSAGCSTGQEPYSLACYMEEFLPSDFRYQIIATDISFSSIMTAKEGLYSADKMEAVSSLYLKRYFTKEGDSYRISSKIRKNIIFDLNNIMKQGVALGFDLVFCRNVLIYFDEKSLRSSVKKFYDSMNNDSYLFIGHSESLYNLNSGFDLISGKYSCYYKKK